MNKTNQKFNITELIEFYYNEKIPLPEKFKTLNYFEHNEKMVIFTHKGREDKYKLDETIAKNIIRELPLEAYKSCFTLDWLKKDHRHSQTIHSAFTGKRFDFIEYVIDQICLLKKNKEFDNDIRTLAVNTLSPIRDFFVSVSFEHLKYTKKDIDEITRLWEKSLDALLHVQSNIWINAKEVKADNLLDKYIQTKESKDSTFNLMKSLSSSLTTNLFKKIFNCLSEESKQELFITNDNSLSEYALYCLDKKTIEFLEKENLITAQHYENVIFNKYNIEHSKSKVSADDIWFYKKAQEKISNKEKIHGSQLMGIVMNFKDNEVIFEDILNKYPQIGTDKILDDGNMSLTQLNFVLRIAKNIGFDEKNFMSSLDNTDRNTVELLPVLSDKFFQKTQISVAEIMESTFTDKIISSVASKNNMSISEAATYFLEEAMTVNLKSSDIDTKKIKI